MITRLAAAKVNLDLRVTGRRADGYHELDSLVVFPSIGDLLTFEPAPDLTLRLEGPKAGSLQDLPTGENLVLRAAERLRSLAGTRAGACITLDKRLPVAAGLGGGSADAAACLWGLSELWSLEVDPSEIFRIGLELGADVPACLNGQACYLTGIGETIAPVASLPSLGIVLVNPGIALSTPRVFKALDGRFSAARDASGTCASEKHASEERAREVFLAALSTSLNDLEAPAISLVPQIAGCLDALREAPGCLLARMSGSGASCFGLFALPDEAAAAAASIQKFQPAWWVADGRLS